MSVDLLALAQDIGNHFGPRHADRVWDWERLPPGPLTELVMRVSDKWGFGRKTAVLIAAQTAATLRVSRSPAGPTAAVTEALLGLADEVATLLERQATRASQRDEVYRAALAAALGRNDIAQAMTKAIEYSGKDGVVRVDRLSVDP